MKPSIIFQFAVRAFTPPLLVFSLIIYWRGHQLPGGGFIGGLLAAIALVLHAACWGPQKTLSYMKVRPQTVTFVGLAVAIFSALLGPLVGKEFFTGLWFNAPFVGALGSPMLFDLGVYLVVAGSVTTVFLTLMEESK